MWTEFSFTLAIIRYYPLLSANITTFCYSPFSAQPSEQYRHTHTYYRISTFIVGTKPKWGTRPWSIDVAWLRFLSLVLSFSLIPCILYTVHWAILWSVFEISLFHSHCPSLSLNCDSVNSAIMVRHTQLINSNCCSVYWQSYHRHVLKTYCHFASSFLFSRSPSLVFSVFLVSASNSIVGLSIWSL